ncbi:hypothetical protein MUB24_20100 [Lederbergia sp. NSJ-179]|uniref:hypothetical protein n=1 Tax=Lederbergia sp. NSJ-179 TaxID=2931402 RepID=UPI001FD5CF06|nr:hypothetical protein [Lederbergia sp. NSJ-179]MCJ7843136.1 hypothetical protein [Lederbergia sp. NSJ-179]
MFLHDHRAPSDNNLRERKARNFKRKQKQVISFRSFECLGYVGDGMTVMATLESQEKNLYEGVAEIFRREREKPPISEK